MESFIGEFQMDKVKVRRNLTGHLAKICSFAWSGDSEHIVSTSTDGNIIVWNALTTYKVHAITLKSHWLMTCAFSSNGDLVASGGLGMLKFVRLYEMFLTIVIRW
jgi:guanine nucleotide-binding protein G(I)/G(S)/G(T) subunit beta-1